MCALHVRRLTTASLIGIALTALPARALDCPSTGSVTDIDLRRPFERYAAAGTFVVTDGDGRICIRFNPQRAVTRFLPASTFKIFNTMVALDEGAIPDETTVLEWDGVDRGSAGWNEDQDMRTAFRRSTVWFYQVLARRVGEDRMRDRVQREGYGNADISGGIDRFWLSGGLRISADEQVAFLRRLYARELGFSRRAQDIANALLAWEKGDGWELFGKTGWTQMGGNQLGWVVGRVERGHDVWFYALNLESPDAAFPMREARERILRELLETAGLLTRARATYVRTVAPAGPAAAGLSPLTSR